jgi:RND family efflux transporter MFP subunit
MRPSHRILLIILVALTSITADQTIEAQQESPGARNENQIPAENCVVEYIEKTPIPAHTEGPLLEINFEEGDNVTKDDVLAVIDDEQAKLAYELKRAEEKEAQLNAANDVNVRNAVNSAKLAKAQAEAFKELRKEGAIPYWEMKTKEFEADRAELSIEMAENNMKIAEVQMIAKRTELQMANFELTRRKITAPLTGHIEEKIAQTGQWVRPGDPIATLIQMDKLRVEGDVDALRYPGQIRKGAPVQVKIYTGSDKPVEFSAKLGFVSMEINTNDEYRVWVEVANKQLGDDWLLKPGMEAEILIQKTDQVF